MVGTPYYLAPELIMSEGYQYKADIWSLGVLLYEMCTLTYPFDEPNISRLSQAICQDDPNYNAIPPGISKNTIKIMKLMLSKDPAKRPSAV